METIGMTTALIAFCLFGITFGMIDICRVDNTFVKGDDRWVFLIVLYSLTGISLFVFLLILVYNILSGASFQGAKGTIIYFTILVTVRGAFSFFVTLHSHSKQKGERKQREINQIKKVKEKSEQRIISKVQIKNLNQLLHRVKNESSGLIPIVDEEMAEMVDAIRKKAHESYNEFSSRKVEFETVQEVLEEAVSDLLAVKEMIQPKKSDSITFYDILGVEVDDSQEEISKAYRDLIRIVHPDVALKGGNAAGNIATLVNLAYDHLKNNNGRRV